MRVMLVQFARSNAVGDEEGEERVIKGAAVKVGDRVLARTASAELGMAA
jgi:hypothetical protein